MSEKYNARVQELEGNEKKKKLILKAVVAFLIIVFMGGIAWGVNDVLLVQGTQELPWNIQGELTPLTKTPSETVNYFKTLLEKAGNKNNTKLSVDTFVEIPEDSISDDVPDASFDEILLYMRSDLESYASELYEDYSSGFGTDFSERLIPADFTVDDILKADVFNGTDDNGNEDSTKCISVTFADAAYPQSTYSVLYKNFNMAAGEKIPEKMRDTMLPIAEVLSSNITCSGFEIFARVNKFTDKLMYIEYIRSYKVSVRLKFVGDLAGIGEKNVSFQFKAKEKQSFTWAGLELADRILWLKKGNAERLEAYCTADDSVTVTWSSSDPEIAAVDEEGYIKGKAVSDKPVTITAQFDYLGNKYSESCTVYVRKPAEKITLNTNELSLKPGDITLLSAEVSPKKATFKTVYWFSEDESIAAVDKDGNITAVSSGSTEIYAVSLDGNFKATCVVTVGE